MPKGFTEVTSKQAKNTLARRFIGLADSLRDLLTRFGLRTYAVRTVHVRWTGGKRGRGAAQIVDATPILPTPKLAGLDPITEVVQPIGLVEQGEITLSQISGRFTEAQLRGYDEPAEGLPDDEEFFYEIEFFPNEGDAYKRMFYVRGPPTYAPGRLQWSVRLVKAEPDRSFNGDAE